MGIVDKCNLDGAFVTFKGSSLQGPALEMFGKQNQLMRKANIGGFSLAENGQSVNIVLVPKFCKQYSGICFLSKYFPTKL